LLTTSFQSLPSAIPTPVLLAMVVLLHFISANGNRNNRIAIKNAAVAGILVPNKPVEEAANGAGVVGCVCCTGSISWFDLEKLRETAEKAIGPSTLSLHFTLNMIINTICVCGAGTMGSGIAQVSATAGFNTILYELNQAVIEKAKMSIEKNLQALAEKNKITPDEKKKIFQLIHFTSDIKECRADVIIEAIIENPEAKIDLFNQLAAINNDKIVFATNTSSLSVTEIGNKILNGRQVIGMHFFNPAPVMKLVEIVKTEKTSNQVVQAIMALVKQLGKTPVICKDSPGFIVNRVARPYYIESLRLIEEGETNFETIDALLESTGFKMGPFKLMDLIGNDINYSVSCSVYEQLNNPERLKPSFIQKEKVEKNELGKKTGKGYYQY